MFRRAANRGDPLRPLLTFLEGKPVPYQDLVAASRRLADALVSRSHSIILITEGENAGVWDLERLNDGEVVDFGLWVARKARAADMS
jgi:hypothetical protein